MEQAAKTQPGDNSGYIFAVSVLTFFLVLAVTAGVHLYLRNNTLQKEHLTKVEESAKQNTQLLFSMEALFEKLIIDIGHISPQITQEGRDITARIRSHVDRVGNQLQKNEPINRDIQYTS